MHAHLRGTGIEVMANSDNVIRGGLTNKHVDVNELVKVVDFAPAAAELTLPEPVGPGVDHYATGCPEFDVWRLAPTDSDAVALPGVGSARILLVVSGSAELVRADERLALHKGESAFLAADEEDVTLHGDAVAFVAASGLR